MTGITGIGNVLPPQTSFVGAGSSNVGGDVLDGVLKSTSPMAELGIMSGMKDDPTKAADLAMAGPGTMALQQLGLPSISDLLKDLGVDKVLKKIPGVSLASKTIGGIAEKATGAVKKVAGGVKKAVSKL